MNIVDQIYDKIEIGEQNQSLIYGNSFVLKC